MKSKSLLTVFMFFMFSMAWAQGFKISGTQLLDANGNNFVIKGVNVPLAWFVNDVNNNIAAIKAATGANCFRIVVTTTTADNAWQTCVQKCIDNKIIPLVELHDVTGNNTPAELNRMAQFWASKAAYLTKPEIAKYILINIANEWSDWYMSATATGEVSRVTWRDAYITAVKTMRDAGIKTTLVCDAAGYGQDNKTQTILAYAKDVQASDTYHNCLFSVHMYCEWAVGGNSNVATLLPAIKNAGIPIIVGEFGWEEGNGSGGYCNIDESLIINTANINGIGWIAWSWKGNGGTENVLDLSNDWAGTNLTDWGKTVTSGAGGTKTAVTASVFNALANAAPVVAITAPANNSSVSAPASVTITANATDSDGSISNVQFYNGTTLLNTDAAAPYSYTWTNVPAGTFSITAKATDNTGASTTSAAVSVTVSTVTTGGGNGTALSNPNATNEAKALYCYIQNLKGKKTLSGQMWSGWGFDELAYIQTNTGKQPAIMGLDFIQESVNNTQVQLATNYWKKGGIPTIMWHMGAPGNGEGYPSSQTTIDINRCFQPGTTEYTVFWAELKQKADHLQQLKDAGVPVLWRPFHELDGGWFWWSKGNGQANETAANKAALFKKLWTTMYDYFVNTRKLDNLIWVLCYSGSPKAAWYPGDQYVDIAGGDTYTTSTAPQLAMYNSVKSIVNDKKPIVYHECGIPPDPAQCLSQGAMWAWWMVWHTSYIQDMDKTYLKSIYSNDLVITLDEVGNIMNACGNTACTPTPIVPYMQTDGLTWVQQSTAQVCAGSTVILGPQPSDAAGWAWKGPGNFTAATREISLTNITVAQAGVYTATYKNAGGCSSTSQITVTVKALPTAPVISTPVTYCQNAGAIPLAATGTGLKWYTTATAGTALTTAPTPVTTVVSTTNYYVSQTTNGCESSRSLIAVTVNALPTAAITTTTPTTFCAGGSVILAANAGYSYKWMNGTTQVGTSQNYTAASAGSYTVEVTNANTCKATSAAATVTVNAVPTAPAVTSAISYCQNAAAVPLTATGTGLKWYIVATAGTALRGAPTPVTTIVGTTNYYVSQTTNGCESSRSLIAVTVNALPAAAITTTTPTTFCAGGSVVLAASAGLSYTWMNGTTQVATSQNYTATTAGSYTVEVTNANTCKATSPAATVTVNALPNAPTVSTPVMYCQNTAVTPLIASGTGLKWYTDATGSTAFTNTPTPITSTIGTTNYYVSQTTNGCESSRSLIAVTVNALPTATITTTTPTTFCAGGNVVLATNSGSSYTWMNGATQVATSQNYTATTAGSYTVEVTNANNCKATSIATTVTVTSGTVWYADADGDGKGDAAVTKTSCAKPTGYVSIAGDLCPADANKTTAGFCGCGNAETDSDGDSQPDCVDADDDNDGIADAADCQPLNAAISGAAIWYADLDGDGKGDASVTQASCTKPSGYVATAGDDCPADADKIAAGNCGCGNTETSCLDCAGVASGTAAIDVCGRCSGGTTGIDPVTDATKCIATDVVDLASDATIKILPNPSNEAFTLLVTRVSDIQILSADGKLVDTFHHVNDLNFGSGYAKGVYFVQISNGSTTQVLRVIKL